MKRSKYQQPQHQTPLIQTQDQELDRRFWPAGKEMPKHYLKVPRQVIPCPQCKRVLMDNMGQAVSCKSSGADLAYFECRACGHSWKMLVKMEA